jgi:glycosyltransferase involved in cell wall biosynthesis
MISICVPVYNGADFIDECILSILNQTFNNFELLISDDASTDNTLDILSKYNDSRIRIIKNNNNNGWVKNCNILISESKYDFYCIIPCDDIVPHDYIEKLYNEIINDSSISNSYPKIKGFGDSDVEITQRSINSNNICERIIDFILNHFNAVSFRGLVRKSKNPELLYMNQTFRNNIYADTYQILQHAIDGKLIEVDVIYKKRYHKNNTHQKWKANINDYINIFYSIFILSKKYFTNQHRLIDIIMKKLDKYKDFFKKRIEKTIDYMVLGGGIQGCCSALYLNKLGYNVAIIEKNNKLLNGASANNEGKIHLGFVYSNDKTLGTAKKMLIDALNFSKSIDFLFDEKINWSEIKSKKFIYLVPKTSLLHEKELDYFFEQVQQLYNLIINLDPSLNYLGLRPEKIYKKIEIPDNFNKDFFECCYETEEYAINQNLLNDKIIDVIKKRKIPVLLENNVKNINPGHNFYEVVTDKNTFYCEHVVNCLWDGKTKIDNCVMENKVYDTNFRFKFGITSEKINLLENEKSITMVNGPFGDFVNFPNYMYFSWYPYSMKGFSCSEEPPNNWNINSLIDENLFLKSHTEIFNFIFGKDFNFINPRIIGGIIVAQGNKDIDNIDSKLHERNDSRIEKKSNYLTISTGKYTSAPYNALLLNKYLL